jgi:hypothetical protein
MLGATFPSLIVKMDVKHLETIYNVFGGHLITINFPPIKWKEHYAYSSIVAGFLQL